QESLSVEVSSMITARQLVERVARSVTATMLDDPARVTVAVEGDDLYLPSQPATSLALAVNDLVQTAIEHACPQGSGRIAIRLGRRDGQCFIEVEDDGVGMRPAAPGGESLGLQIVPALATEELPRGPGAVPRPAGPGGGGPGPAGRPGDAQTRGAGQGGADAAPGAERRGGLPADPGGQPHCPSSDEGRRAGGPRGEKSPLNAGRIPAT